MVKVTVDGRIVEVAETATALDALRVAGLDVPTGCSDPRLKPQGGCRLCLVRLKGQNRLVTSCALPVHDGMEIEVDTPELIEARKAEIAMLAQKYPAGYAEEFPDKTFHKWLTSYGLTGAVPKCDDRIDRTNPYFLFDPAACIKCFKCVQICADVQGSFVWQILDRASEIHVVPNSLTTLAESSCKSCGACVDACPTSALMDKTRVLEGAPDKWTRTTCPYCGVGCELSVGTKNDRIVQVLPVLDAPVNKGHLCVKGRYAHQFVHSPDRVQTPLIRRNGKLEPATWDEAMNFAASEMKRILNERGPGSVGVLGSARAPNEDNYMAQKFARIVVGTNNVDCCARVCHGPSAAAMKAMIGTGAATNSYNDIEVAGAFLITGCNPTDCHPIVGERIKQAAINGAKLIVIDPRAIELTQFADVHVNLKPGTNVPMLHAMAHTIIAEGLVDPSFLEGRVDEYEEFKTFVEEWTPERVSKICGVPAETIRQAARLYATAKPTMAFHGLGVTEHLQGTEGVMCIVNLALLTGNMGKPGCGVNPLRGQNNVQGSAHMGCEPSNLTGFVSIPAGKERFTKVWNSPIPETQGLNLMQMLDAAAEGKFKAIWSIGYDIYFTNASAKKTRKALEAMELVIVQDLFLNETAIEFAHVFFPASSSFERDGTFMNAERRVQLVRKAINQLGDSKPDWEIIQMLAKAMGHPDGFEFTSANEIWEEVRQVWMPGAGMSYERLEHGGLQWPCPSEDHPGTQVLHRDAFPIGVRAALKRIDFTPTPEITSLEFPFLLNTGRSLYQFNAGTMTRRTFNNKLKPSDTLDMHPEDAAALGLEKGQQVRITSRYGEASLPLRYDRAVRRGELFATFHSPEIFLNLITSPVRDGITSTPEFKVTAVRVEAMEPALSK